MLNDFINMTQGQLFIKYWWLWLIILAGALSFIAIAHTLPDNGTAFEPVERFYKLKNGMYFKVRITEPGTTVKSALKAACDLLGVPPSSVTEVDYSEYSTRSGATIAKAQI